MLSELQQQKLARLFHCIDADGNGRLEAADLDRIAVRLAEARGWSPESDGAHKLSAAYEGMWKAVAPYTAGDYLSLDGFIAYHDDTLPIPGAFESNIGALSDLIFETLDADGDGLITVEEHRTFYEIFNIDPQLADTVFPMWDRDASGFVSTAELGQVVREFFFSMDPESPSNWLFGPPQSERHGVISE